MTEIQNLKEKVKELEDKVSILHTNNIDRRNYEINYFENLSRLRSELYSEMDHRDIRILIIIAGWALGACILTAAAVVFSGKFL